MIYGVNKLCAKGHIPTYTRFKKMKTPRKTFDSVIVYYVLDFGNNTQWKETRESSKLLSVQKFLIILEP